MVGLRHLLVEFQMDLFQLLDRRQPPPRQGHGLPEAWRFVFFLVYIYLHEWLIFMVKRR